tara:strand:- start:965 stop:1408 length:444 start_codon:yes stop_codon:yes gene_type:complete
MKKKTNFKAHSFAHNASVRGVKMRSIYASQPKATLPICYVRSRYTTLLKNSGINMVATGKAMVASCTVSRSIAGVVIVADRNIRTQNNAAEKIITRLLTRQEPSPLTNQSMRIKALRINKANIGSAAPAPPNPILNSPFSHLLPGTN